MGLRAATRVPPNARARRLTSPKTTRQVPNHVEGEAEEEGQEGVQVRKNSGFQAGGWPLLLRPVVRPFVRLLPQRPLAMRPSAGRCKGRALGGGAGSMWVLGRV